MKLRYRFAALVVALGSVTIGAGSYATTSTVNPSVPAANSPLSSAVVRNNFAAAYNDINALWGAVASGTGISSISGDLSCTGSPAASCALANTATARADLGLPLGTSGAVVGLLNGNLTFSGVDRHSLNAAALPATQTGTVLQLGNADGSITRLEVDAFGNTPHFSAVRWDGTNAAPTAVQSGDALGSLNFWGYNGTGVVGPQAAVRCFASQAWSVGANGTYCDLDVTPNGSTALTAAMTIGNDGGITVGSPTGGDKGAGTINATGLYLNGSLVSTSTGGVGGASLSSLTAATASNSIDNAGYNQTWTWSALGTATGHALSGTTSGAGKVFSSAVTAAPNTAYAGYFSNPATSGGYALGTSGNVVVNGTGSSVYALDVEGASGQVYVANFNSANTTGTGIQISNGSAGAHVYDLFTNGSANGVGYFGFYDLTANATALAVNGTNKTLSTSSDGIIGFSTVAGFAANPLDTGLSRDAAGIVDFGNGTAANTTGKAKAAAYFIAGTKFSVSGCSATATSGGATGGLITLGANSCTVVVTMGNSVTATTGFVCDAHDRTAPTVLIGGESSSTTTTASISIPAGAGTSDVISFKCSPAY